MLRIRAYNRQKVEEEIYVYLREIGSQVELVATTENGEVIDRGILAVISREGIELMTRVNEEIGFPLTTEGRLCLVR